MASAIAPAPPPLLRQWRTAMVFGFGLLAAAAGFIGLLAGAGPALRWSGPAAAVWAHVLLRLRRLLPLNIRPGTTVPSPGLGAATAITLVRAGLLSGLAGFVFQPLTALNGEPDVWAWVPGALYLAAVALDFLDGLVARTTGYRSGLGARFDAECDALGLLIAATLAVAGGRAPPIYLVVGAGVYALAAAFRLRRRTGRSTAPVKPRAGARLAAGGQMVAAGLILLPLFDPSSLGPAAWVLAAVMFFSLGKDWTVACRGEAAGGGRLSAAWLTAIERILTDWLPLVLRAAITFAALLSALGIGSADLTAAQSAAAAAAFSCALLCALGVAARAAAMLLGILSAFEAGVSGHPVFASVTAIALALFFTGGGKYSLWQPEDRIFLAKIGADD